MAMISELLRKKAAAVESEQKLQAFTQFVKERKQKTANTRHKHHWFAEARKLQRERQILEAELQMHVSEKESLFDEVEEEVAELTQERTALVNEVFGSVLGWKVKVGNSKYHPEDLQSDLSFIKKYLHQLGQSLAEAEVQVQTEIAASRVPWREGPSVETPEDFPTKFDALMTELKTEGLEMDPNLVTLLRESGQQRFCESSERIATLHNEYKALSTATDWSAAEQALFQKLWKEYGHGSATDGVVRSDFLDRLRVELRQRSVSEIHAHWWAQERLRFLRQRLRVARTEHAELLESLCLNARQALAAAHALHVSNQEREMEKQRLQAERESLQAKLAECELQKQEKKERQAAEKLQQQAEEAEKARIERERYEEHVRAQLEKLQKFREQEAEEQRRLAQIRKEEEELEAEQKRRLMERNAQRVTYREDEWERKRLAAESKRAALEMERKAREERLQALANQVKIVAESDPQRLLQATECFRNREDADVTGKPNIFQHNGYTNDVLAKDHRFRLQEALGKAGLLHTDYARQIVLSAAPARPPRPDMRTTFAD
eukprot:TRINITY_DN53694_c0_g1_i1.p1 TRINITY_DN53694_c0_g1~~TRINITY_DN53694_c0_g1_i1.p1  ORF type:complete len:551 (-),score=120.21 TRINITY_DN53694_c0_g1_i1:61-1713(-)